MKINNKIIRLKRFVNSIVIASEARQSRLMTPLKARKPISLLLALTIILSLFLVAVPMAGIAETTDYYVDPNGTDDVSHGTASGSDAFKTIQYAINDSRVIDGDTINVAAGTYDGFEVNKPLTLLGAQANVDPAGSVDRGTPGDGDESVIVGTVTIKADDVTVNGFKTGYTINAGYNHALNVNISYNISVGADGHCGAIHLQGKASGPSYHECDGGYIGYNTISATTSIDWQGGGIWTVGNDDVTIEHNHILNSQYMGIFVPNHVGDRNTIRYNTITNSGHTSIRFWGGSEADISYNVIDGAVHDGIWVDSAADNSIVSYNQISDTIYAGINIREDCTGATVTYNDISGCGTGVEKHSGNVTGVTINYNKIHGNSMGVTNHDPTAIDATNNWWGDASGPKQATTNPSATGDEVSDYVAYDPWYIDEAMTTLSNAIAEVWVDNDYTDDNCDGHTWGSDAFNNIQDGINGVDEGGTVNVAAGTYNATSLASIVITTDDLSLIGESRDGTIIDAGTWGTSSAGWPRGIHVYANNVTIKNLTVQGFTGDGTDTGGYGVVFRDYDHDDAGEGFVYYDGGRVENVKLQDSYAPVYAFCLLNLTVENCLIQNNLSDGMFIAKGSANATVTGNTVTNSGDHGIWVGGAGWCGPSCPNATITNNTVNGF